MMKYRFHNLVCHNTYMKIFYNNTNVIHRHGYSADETDGYYGQSLPDFQRKVYHPKGWC